MGRGHTAIQVTHQIIFKIEGSWLILDSWLVYDDLTDVINNVIANGKWLVAKGTVEEQ